MPDDQVAITLPRNICLDVARVLRVWGYLSEAATVMRALCPGCQNGHPPEAREVEPSGRLTCRACTAEQRARRRARETEKAHG